MYQAAHIDFETRSPTDLKKSGVYRYAEDPNTSPWGFKYRFDSGDVYEWRPGWADPVALLDHIARGGRVVAHNAAFERTIWNWVIVGRMCRHWPMMTIQQQDCTMARAATIAHPQSLDTLCNVLQTNNRKDRVGHAVMLKQSKPRSYLPDGTIVWWDDPELTNQNMSYCGLDVLTECDVDEKIPTLSPRWRQVWEFDQLINDRGVYIDTSAVKQLASLAELAKKEADRTMRTITNRTVPKCTNVGKLIEFLNGRGIQTTTLKKGDQEDLIYLADLREDSAARDAIELRRASSKTSTAKYAAMLKCVCSDDRIRGLLNYHGASTGRWAGRLVQPQNFPRVDPDDKDLEFKIEWLHEQLKLSIGIQELYDRIVLLWGPLEPMMLLSKALRSMIRAAPNKKLVGGDFANIEGRVNAWLAGELWKLDAFREYDLGTGPDLYKVAYARSFGVPVETIGKGNKRQIGKVQELALGYQGGVGAFITMGDTYGVNPFELSGPVQAAAPAAQWDYVAAQYGRSNDYGLQEREWTAIKIIVNNWRDAHPAIVQSWWNYQDAAIEAVGAPGSVVRVGAGNRATNISYYSDGRCLWCILPSGRMLCYSAPELVSELTTYTDKATGEVRERWKNKVTYWGMDSVTKQWSEGSLYGGMQCENIVQATSCDILVDAMFNVETAGFPVILTVHDEILSEIDEDMPMGENEFAAIMSQISETYEGLPIAVAAWEGERFG